MDKMGSKNYRILQLMKVMITTIQNHAGNDNRGKVVFRRSENSYSPTGL